MAECIKASKPRGRPKGVKNRVKLKIQSPGSASAGAGAILKRLRNSKIDGKGRSRCESSPLVGNSKRPNSSKSSIDDTLSKGKSKCSFDGNDGSFFNLPLESSMAGPNSKYAVGKGSIVDPCLVSNGIDKSGVAVEEHTKAVDTEKSNMDGVVFENESSEFVFGNMHNNSKGILKAPMAGLNVSKFGPSLFYKASSVWSSFKPVASASKPDGKINIESFAEKMKRGVEDRELQMSFTPHCVSNSSDGSKRVVITLEDIKKGSEACALQLYGYFVGKNCSGIGRPMLMDKLTKERCLKKAGKLDFARVLVEVSAVYELPHSIEIEYPQIGERPARIGLELMLKLEAKKAVVGKGLNDERYSGVNVDGEGFITVGKNNKPVGNFVAEQGDKQKPVMNNRNFQNRNSHVSNRFPNGNNRQNSTSGGSFQQGRFGNSKSQNSWKAKGANVNFNQGKQGSKGNNSKAGENVNKPVMKPVTEEGLVLKPPLSTKFNEKFKPKMLVRGSGSTSKGDKVITEDVPVSNSFDALKDQEMVDKEDAFIEGMDEEYINVIWPKLKSEVEEVMKSGVYPSLESENEGMADVMKPENINDGGPVVEKCGSNSKQGLNES
ncbi:hypothetical protein CTI12_AA262610 [Artemisia annua]|uniref:Uncharacterized protein n=1 Tax=Artemisia annua TaxID=35608 RepID=A0A2U1NIB6_ARTAN|nr:hypothetical protein CTI12_AA262610 [Artemisia annua]